ncbi:MAG TPA: proline--tRNA ligase, partial [Spirochaetia bacterium]|nr:proline--tRNA ligase [Spirochaetia bacterium]
KAMVPVGEAAEALRTLLQSIQSSLFQRALKFRTESTFRVHTWDEFKKLIDEPGGFLEAGWCGDAACEARVKEETKATIRLLPLERKETGGVPCVVCGKAARDIAVFGRAY